MASQLKRPVDEYRGLAGTLSREDWDRLYAKMRRRHAEQAWQRFTWHWRRRNLKPPPKGLTPDEYRKRLKALYGGRG